MVEYEDCTTGEKVQMMGSGDKVGTPTPLNGNDVAAYIDRKRKECQKAISKAIEQFYDDTGLTVKVVKVARRGQHVWINAACGIETEAFDSESFQRLSRAAYY